MKRSTARLSPSEQRDRAESRRTGLEGDGPRGWRIPSGSDLVRFAIGRGFLVQGLVTTGMYPETSKRTGRV